MATQTQQLYPNKLQKAVLFACSRGSIEALQEMITTYGVKKVLDFAADHAVNFESMDEEEFDELCHHVDPFNYSPAFAAAYCKQYDTLRFIVENGPKAHNVLDTISEPFVCPKEAFSTIPHMAAHSNDVKLLELLLELHPTHEFILTQKGHKDRFPLSAAAKAQSVEATAFILNRSPWKGAALEFESNRSPIYLPSYTHAVERYRTPLEIICELWTATNIAALYRLSPAGLAKIDTVLRQQHKEKHQEIKAILAGEETQLLHDTRNLIQHTLPAVNNNVPTIVCKQLCMEARNVYPLDV